MASVTSEEVAVYWPLCVFYARRFENVNYRAEFDDLAQMGWIAVWKSLERGFKPTGDIIQNAMRDWIKFVTHEGRANENPSVSF